jgi:hypothetical protein
VREWFARHQALHEKEQIMLNSLHSNNRSGSNGQGLVVNVLTGRALGRALRGKSPKERACLVALLIERKVAFEDLSPAQVARLCKANSGAVSVMLGHAGKRGPRDSTLNHLIKRYGANTLMRAVDRLTAPTRVAAE